MLSKQTQKKINTPPKETSCDYEESHAFKITKKEKHHKIET
jgi:hypothetical protein